MGLSNHSASLLRSWFAPYRCCNLCKSDQSQFSHHHRFRCRCLGPCLTRVVHRCAS